MNGIIGVFEGIPIRYCKCGAEPIIDEGYNTFFIYCAECGEYHTGIHVDPSVPHYVMSFDDKKEIIEDWNAMVQLNRCTCGGKPSLFEDKPVERYITRDTHGNIHFVENHSYKVKCIDCKRVMCSYKTPEEAIKFWNEEV